VRLAACRLFGAYFAARDANTIFKQEHGLCANEVVINVKRLKIALAADYFMRDSALYLVGKQFTRQLESEHVEDALSDQVPPIHVPFFLSDKCCALHGSCYHSY
jgi:hypothetical protein